MMNAHDEIQSLLAEIQENLSFNRSRYVKYMAQGLDRHAEYYRGRTDAYEYVVERLAALSERLGAQEGGFAPPDLSERVDNLYTRLSTYRLGLR